MKQKTIVRALLMPMMSTMGLAMAQDEMYLDVNGVSRHQSKTFYYKNEERKYNAINPGLGLTLNVAKHVDVLAGFFENSYYRTSVYAGVNLKTNFDIAWLTVSPGLSLGVVSGYDKTPVEAEKITALALPNIAFTFQHVGARMGYIPRPKAKRTDLQDPSSVLFLQIQYKIK